MKFELTIENISGFAVVFFALLGAWSLLKQNKRIWEERTGESISVIWMVYFFYMYVTSGIYAIHIKSIPMFIHAVVRALVHIPILIGLWKFKGYSVMEKFSFMLLPLACICLIVLQYKSIVFLMISIGAVFATLLQPLEIIKNKTKGALELKVLIVYLFASIFWCIYSFVLKDWAMEILMVSSFLVIVFTIIVWVIYRK